VRPRALTRQGRLKGRVRAHGSLELCMVAFLPPRRPAGNGRAPVTHRDQERKTMLKFDDDFVVVADHLACVLWADAPSGKRVRFLINRLILQ
jgi:hypothetical protein